MNIENTPKNIFGFDLNIPKGNDDVPELLEQLKDGVSSLMNSNRYKDYLDYMSSFYNYSPRNILMIISQNNKASKVGSFTFWKSHNRYVKKGEHGMKILAPNIVKEKKEIDVQNKDSKTSEKNTDSEIISRITGFRIATVFDITQTDGAELPSIVNNLTQNTPISQLLIQSIKSISDLPIEYEDLPLGMNGYADEDKIVLRKELDPDQEAKTLIHEYTHSQFHKNIEDYSKNRSYYEIQAESTAYVVSKHFGLDTSDYSFGYVTSWAKEKSLDNYFECLKKVNDMSEKIITQIKTYLENEYEQKQTLEKNLISKQLKAYGYKPSLEAINNIHIINIITNKRNSLSEIKKIAKNPTPSSEKNLAEITCQILKNQEQQKLPRHSPEPI